MGKAELRRRQMVQGQIAARGVTDARVLEAMGRVPREAFVPDHLAEFAYEDSALPIVEGQTILQPYMVALMAEAAQIAPQDRVLEIGTGSGYAAAVLGELAAEVFTIERHPSLASAAQERLSQLGYDNVRVRRGDGSAGWPDAAPFDAIIVTAAGPGVPEPLLQQLAVGGRLVIPVGDAATGQDLLRITRRGDDTFDEEDLGPVAFVPLIGAHGWSAQNPDNGPQDPPAGVRKPSLVRTERRPRAVELIEAAAQPLSGPTDPALGEALDAAAAARVVLIGEASHGTSEFYRARAAITRRLIEHHGFTIVAVEADWPDAAQIDRYVRQRDVQNPEEQAFARFPAWMWRNTDVRDFVDWLHDHNAGLADPARRAGFYGLDLYSLYASMARVLDYLDQADPEAAQLARERYACLTPWQHDPAAYGRAALRAGFELCARDAVAVVRDLLRNRLNYMAHDHESFLDAEQNARLVADAEAYYRVMYYGGHESWNLRDRHMFETLERLLAARGPEAKAVVWAHNSHIGDARATEMGWRGELNIGQLCREHYGDEAFNIGFGTDRGTVAAATDWDGPMEIKTVRPALAGSYESLCRDARPEAFLLTLRPDDRGELRRELEQRRLERAIGVIYRPETERWSHYFDAVLPRQFDAYVWFAETTAVTPLAASELEAVPETYPFGL
jgi:protein-L-isoaspartate(D-aspartate) O-methyltransferase